MFTQRKYEALDSQGNVLGYIWANDSDEAGYIAQRRYQHDYASLRATRIKKRAPLKSHRSTYKADFYGRKGAFANV